MESKVDKIKWQATFNYNIAQNDKKMPNITEKQQIHFAATAAKNDHDNTCATFTTIEQYVRIEELYSITQNSSIHY